MCAVVSRGSSWMNFPHRVDGAMGRETRHPMYAVYATHSKLPRYHSRPPGGPKVAWPGRTN